MADNRQSKRTPVTLKIKFKSETLDQFINRYAVDVSHGGIFIRTKDPLPVGTTMRFEFQLKDSSPLIKGEGTVVWTREHDPSRTGVAPGMGVRFDRLADGSRDVLEQILSRKARKSSSRGFVDTPTRVAPSPLVEDLARGSQPGSFVDDSSDSTPLPSAVPFDSDADDFAPETFDQATKVHSMAELAKLSATEDVRAIEEALLGPSSDSDDESSEVHGRADSEGPTRLVGEPGMPENTLLYARGKPDPESRAETVPFEGNDLLAGADAAGDPDDEAPTRALELPVDDLARQAYDPDLDDELDDEPVQERAPRMVETEVPSPLSVLSGLAADSNAADSDAAGSDAAGLESLPNTLDSELGHAPSADDAADDEAEAEAETVAEADEDDDEDAHIVTTSPPRADESIPSRASARDDQPEASAASERADSESSSMPLILVAIVLILALGGGAYFMFLRDKGGEAAGQSETDAQATPVELVDAAPLLPDAALPADAPLPDAPSDQVIMDPDATMVEIVVRSEPGRATAELVGTDQQGTTPMKFEVAEGQTYTVLVSRDGYVSQEVELDPAKPGPVRVTLALAPMILRIKSTPDGARVYVDGRKVDGETPNTFVLPDSFRTKRRLKVAIRKPGYEKLNVMVSTSDFQPEGDEMVKDVMGIMVEETEPPPGSGSGSGESSSNSGGDSKTGTDGAAKSDGDGGDGDGGDGDGGDGGDGDGGDGDGGDGDGASGDTGDGAETPDGDGTKPKDPAGPTPDWAN